MAERLSAVVRHWSVDGGFGFLNDGQLEYFCHGSQLKNCYSLEVGDKVTFTAAPSKKKAGKKEAKEVYLVDGQGAATRMMGRGGFGSSTAVKTRGRAEPSISSTVPIIESQKNAPKAAAPHRQAVGLSKGVPSQLRQNSKADQSTGQSTAAASSSARATASAAALSQHGSATLPKSLGEEKQSAKSGSQPVFNHKEMQWKGEPTGKKDRAMQKKQMDLVIATTGLDDVVKVEEASHKIPRSEDLETMSATTRSSLLETSESVRDSDTDSCQGESIEEESFDSLVPQQAKSVTPSRKQPAASKKQAVAAGDARPAAAPQATYMSASAQCDEDDVASGQQIGSVPSWNAYEFGSQNIAGAVQTDASAQHLQDAQGYCCCGPLQPLLMAGGGEAGGMYTQQFGMQPVHPANASQLQVAGGGGTGYNPLPQAMMAMVPGVPAASQPLAAGFVPPQSLRTLPALPAFYVDPRGGVHPLQQMMVPVAVPISNIAPANGAATS